MSLRLFISRDVAAVAVGADDVANALRTAADRAKADVELVRTGSRGLLWLEPLVEVATATGRIGYGPATAADADAILRAALTGGAMRVGR